MRVVGGSLRGRTLAGPAKGDLSIRPTSDRARESLFNIIGARWPEKLDATRVIDLFAGTGAVGFEALSRGARYCLFVEIAAQSRALLRTNVEAFGLQGNTRIFRRDAATLGPAGAVAPFDLAFLDPPYGKRLGEKAMDELAAGGWLTADALVILEEAADAEFELPDAYVLEDERQSGQSVLRFLTLKG